MIYFFDNELNMVKVATSKNVISAVHEHELNGLILGTVETDLSYTEAFINDVDYFGYYYKDNYYLHKIKRVEHEHENELVRITGRHIFFEDMLYGDYIRDVRPMNRDALYILNQTISANTRWQTVMTDTSKLHSETYYWVPPMEVLNDLTENVGVEYEPKILFDGQKINGFQLHVANRIGEDTPIRVPFGSRVLNLKYEVDYSEIVTALYGHGKGEEVGDGYGRRINFSSVNFSRNGVVSPAGRLYMENPNVTAQYGKDDGSPKFGRIIFEDIESTSELANATYEAYLEQSRPKMLFEASVVDLGDVGMGDGVLIIRREYDVYFNARIHKLMVDLLDAENADVELGDYAHFKESKVQRKTRESNNQYKRETSSRIQQLKEQFNERFDGEVAQMLADFEQALIDAHAEIQAAEERMETLIEYERDTMMNEFNENVQEARNYAEQQAQEKAAAVRTDLETVTSGHQSMLEVLESNVLDIDDFLGNARDITLDQRLLDMTQDFDQRIRNSSRDASNMLRGSRFDEPDMINPHFGGVSLHTTEHENFIRLNTVQSNIPLVIMNGELHLHAGVEYHLHIEYRTDAVTELDGFVFYHNDGTTERLENRGLTITGLTTSGTWEHASMTLTPNAEMSGRLAIGTRRTYGTSPDGTIDVRLPYLTTTAHDQWLPHPRDENQNITEISRRITDLEDGYSDFIVRSVWDAEMNSLNQTIRDYRTTVDGVEDTIIQLQNSDVITRGREVLDTVDGFSRKVWLGDIDRPNLIPFADVLRETNRNEWIGQGSRFNGSSGGLAIVQADSLGNYIGMESPKIYDYVESGETYTLSWEGYHLSGYQLNDSFDYVYLVGMTGNNIRLYNIQRTAVSGYVNRYHYTATFEMPSTITENTRILFGVSRDGESGGLAYVRFGKPKLELGTIASPFETSYSMLEQRADEMMLAVQGIGERGYLNQSDIVIRSDYVNIGSQRIDGDDIGSFLRVSPSGIDAVAEAMRLSGDLYVDGDITALAVDAMEGEFARLWAAEFSAITIDVDDIQGLTARFNYLYTLNANIERLVSQTAFINEINTLSLDAVYADLRSVNSEIMTSNIIKADWVEGGTALFDKVFISNAMVERLTSKSAFIRDIQAIEITANQLNLTTLTNRINQIEGGLRITRPDGVDWVRNGQARGHVPVQVSDGYAGANIRFNGTNFITGSSTYQTMKYFYTPHEGTRLRVVFAVGLFGGPSGVEFMHVRVRGFSGYNPINMGVGSNSQRVRVIKGETNYVTLDIPMAPPNYAEMAAYLEIRRDPDGQHSDNEVYARLLHIGQYE